MINDNSLKTQDMLFKIESFDIICLTQQVNIKNMYLSLKNKLLFSKKPRFSCLTVTEYCILDLIHDNSLKTQDIRFKLVSFDSIRVTLQVKIKNEYVL